MKYIIALLLTTILGYAQKSKEAIIVYSDSLQINLIEEIRLEREEHRKKYGLVGDLPPPIFVEGLRKIAIHRSKYISKFPSDKVWKMCLNNGSIHLENDIFPGFISLKNKNDRAMHFDLVTGDGESAKNTQEIVVALHIDKNTTQKEIAKYIISQFKESFKNEVYHWGALMSGCNETLDFINTHRDRIGIGASIIYFNDNIFSRALVTIQIGYYGDYEI